MPDQVALVRAVGAGQPQRVISVNNCRRVLAAIYFQSFRKENHGKPPRFLWNAKMRFGKTFTAYQLAKKMGWRKVLVLTFKPAVQNAWEEDLKLHVDFKGWQFISPGACHTRMRIRRSRLSVLVRFRTAARSLAGAFDEEPRHRAERSVFSSAVD